LEDAADVAMPQRLYHEPMSAAFVENLRRFVRYLPPEAALEVLTDPLEAIGGGFQGKKDRSWALKPQT
jgi:hypothetical protein